MAILTWKWKFPVWLFLLEFIFQCKEVNLSNANHYEPVHVPVVENDFPDFGDGPGIVSYDDQGKSGDAT